MPEPPITLTLEEALTNINNALGSINANRQTHDILTASVEKVKNEIATLHAHLATSLPPDSNPG